MIILWLEFIKLLDFKNDRNLNNRSFEERVKLLRIYSVLMLLSTISAEVAYKKRFISSLHSYSTHLIIIMIPFFGVLGHSKIICYYGKLFIVNYLSQNIFPQF